MEHKKHLHYSLLRKHITQEEINNALNNYVNI
jgi:hypothetical protein